YSSPACPSCKVFHDEAMDGLIERVKTGSIQLIFVPLTTGSITNAPGAARAVICATEQGKAWELQDVMFSWQAIFGNQAFTNNRIVAALDALGVNNDNYNACLSSQRPSEVLASAEQAASGLLNYIGTPTIAINGVVPTDSESGEVINDSAGILAAIDRAIAQAPAPSSNTTAPTVEPTSAGAEAAATEVPTEASTETAVPTDAATATDAPTATIEATATSGG
ncbi:MAG: thioredoxin domain-containing protein, partial [Anaerolineae bacterium]|nr:thioredoxin domain-containing protein [Anaerolineae bacterium]